MCRTGVRALVMAMLLWSAGCAVNPVTGERELALISEEQEIQLGTESAQQVEQSIGLVDDVELQRYVSEVGHSLAAQSERPDLPWNFAVVDDPTPNAFALPGGYIYVTRGLATLLTSEAQLAAVLGHEIGHVTARHSVSQLSRAQLAQLGFGLGLILVPEIAQFGDVVGTGLQLLFLRYGRDDERQSDELGFRYMLEAGYDIAEMEDVFQSLLSAGELAGQSPLPNWLSSHPAESERIESARRRAEELEASTVDLRTGRDDYLDRIDGLVYGTNPRHGFFRDDWFYHPELIFRFRVPADWQRQNLATVVQAVSPEQDAAVELTIVPASSPAEAAQRMFAGEGIEALRSTPHDINGNPSVITEFRAQAQGGIVHGLAAYISHGEAVYQLIGYAPEQVIGSRGPQLEEIVTSFSGVTDREILEIQPNRLEIVTLPESMTIEEFAREYPSEISNEELALINHVEPGAAIPAGTRLKRVVQ